MKNILPYYPVLFIWLLLMSKISVAQITGPNYIEDVLISNEIDSIKFDPVEITDTMPIVIHLGDINLSINHAIPNIQSNDTGFVYLNRTIISKGKTFSIDSECLNLDNYMIGQWLSLHRCLYYKDRKYQYLFTQWYLHFTNGISKPSLITILVFEGDDYVGCLNYISDDEDFEHIVGYYNKDDLIDVPIMTGLYKDACLKYSLYSIEPDKGVRFVPARFDDRDSVIICNE